MRLRSWIVACVALIATALLLGRALSTVVVDYAWYSAMGAPQIFWERVIDTTLLQGGAWLVGSLFAFANLHAVRRTIADVAVPSRVANLELTAMVPRRRLTSITVGLAATIGLVVALPMSDWTQVAMARHGLSFVEREGILDRDFGFYVYQLPFEETTYLWALATLVITVLVTLLLYALTRSLRMDGRRIIATNHVRRHLTILGTVVLALLAWSYRLDAFDLLQRGSGPDGLFLRVDHVVTLQVDRVLEIVCLVAAPILLRAGWTGQVRMALFTLTAVLFGALAGRQVVPVLLSRGSLIGDPAQRDRAYVATRTLVSRRAYDVDAIDHAGSARAPRLRARTLLTSDEVASRVSVWEADAFRQRSSDTRNAQIDAGASGWLAAGAGHLHALMIRRPVAQGERWSAAIADATSSALRDSILDVAVGGRGDDDDSVEPIVAPGLSGHKLISDPAGVLGPSMRSVVMRLTHAWALRDPDLLSADTVSGPAARLVTYRDARARVARLAPVFVQGDIVQPILHDGAVLWAINVYSASDHYPLSQRWIIAGNERSYFRFAATALIDASTGRVRFVPAEQIDAVAHTWFDRLPSIVTPLKDLPPALADALPPASESALVQARTFARFGSRLEGAVVRHLPDSLPSTASLPAHLVDVGSGLSPAWSVALLDNGDQVDGIVTAVGGRLRRTVWDSTALPRVRWSVAIEQLRGALDSARTGVPDASRREPRVRIGRAQIVPTEGGPLLVQSLIWNRADGTPLITRVGVLHNGRVAMGFSLSEALAAWRGAPVSTTTTAAWPLLSGNVRDEQITRLYDAMRDAMKRGDWTRFGATFDSLGVMLGKPPR